MDTSQYEDEFEDQLQKIHTQSWEINITDREPVIVTVTDEAHDRTHTVRPWKCQCSCVVQDEDDMFCDHLLLLVDHDGLAGALVREYFKERQNSLFKKPDWTEMISDKVNRITAALNVVDADHCMARTWVDGKTLLQNISEDAEETSSDSIESAITPDDDLAEYEEMVKQFRIDS